MWEIGRAGINKEPRGAERLVGVFVVRAKVGRGSRVVSYSKVELRAQFDQTAAHDLYHVPPRVILHLVARLLVQDGAVIENVVHVEVRLHLPRLAEPKDPAETEIELFDPLSVQC